MRDHRVPGAVPATRRRGRGRLRLVEVLEQHQGPGRWTHPQLARRPEGLVRPVLPDDAHVEPPAGASDPAVLAIGHRRPLDERESDLGAPVRLQDDGAEPVREPLTQGQVVRAEHDAQRIVGVVRTVTWNIGWQSYTASSAESHERGMRPIDAAIWAHEMTTPFGMPVVPDV